MKHEERIQWMALWCAKHAVALQLAGECGFGRKCVGIIAGDLYPDYEWYEEETFERIDNNGDVWRPIDHYHKHTCVAVLGRGIEAETQLYLWLKWFDANWFGIETGFEPNSIQIFRGLGMKRYARMVRGGS